MPVESLSKLSFSLERRSRALRSDFRPLRRIAVLVLAVANCHGRTATYEQVHVLNWALRSRSSRKRFLEFLAGDVPPSEVVVRIDPTMDRIASLAVGLNLLLSFDRGPTLLPEHSAGVTTSKPFRLRLATKGEEMLQFIENSDLLVEERGFFKRLGRRITQKQVQQLFYWMD